MALILTDLDDVLIDLRTSWIKELNKKANTNIKISQIDRWDIGSFFPSLSTSEVFGILDDPTFWDDVKPKKDAIKYIQKLQDDGHRVLICTASYYKSLSFKIPATINKYFPNIGWEDTIVTTHKALVSGDYIIDDNWDNLIYHQGIRILMDAPYNRHYSDGDGYDFRTSTWEQIYETITQCEKVKSALLGRQQGS